MPCCYPYIFYIDAIDPSRLRGNGRPLNPHAPQSQQIDVALE